MGSWIGRVGLAMVLALMAASAGLLTSVSSASTASTASSTVAAAEPEYRDTHLLAGYPRLNGLTVSLRPSARLTDAVTGLPLAGQEVVFYIDVDIFPSCTATTDANGVAKCSGAKLQWLVLTSRTYEAVFAGATVGDIGYQLSRNRATLLRP